jgi:hypothetical protein
MNLVAGTDGVSNTGHEEGVERRVNMDDVEVSYR